MRIRLILIALMVIILLASCGQAFESSPEKRIENIEQGLLRSLGDPPWKSMALQARMAYYNVPGVSIALIDNYEIEWAKGYGVLEAGGNQSVTPETLFQTGSIAKPVVAAAALNFAEKDMVELDSDVNRNLVSWQIPEDKFTAVEKVTLRRLLSHSAGITVHGFRGYTQGEAIPNLLQILNGEPPANSAPIRVDTVPGEKHRYSGGGYMIVQQLLEDVAEETFPEIMQSAVLAPWGMRASTFDSPLPENLQATAASGHRADGSVIPGKWHIYPEMGSGASMWSTPSDMARFSINLMQIYKGHSDDVLSNEMIMQMLSQQHEDNGLGFFVGDDGGDRLYFFHDGANDGYKSYLIAYPKRGEGLVIMTNGDNGDALGREILNSATVEYGWVRNYTLLMVSIATLLLVMLFGFLLLKRRKSTD